MKKKLTSQSGFLASRVVIAVVLCTTCLIVTGTLASDCIDDTWTATSNTINTPSARGAHTAVWTGTEMIVWGGNGQNGSYPNTGGRYNPVTNSWTATSTINAPEGRGGHTA